jgi:GLPGLI family protein
MKKIILINLLSLICCSTSLFAQKIISEGTINYNILIKINNKPKENGDSATTVIYLKGDLSRTDMVNTLGSEITIADSKTGNAVILKQYSGQKLMITLTKENRDDKYSRYDGIVFQPTTETKVIANYTCKKATALLKNGTSFVVYYTTDVNAINKDYDPMFKNLPGLPIQYEFSNGILTFQYTLTAINFNTIPSAKFDIPKSGYRVMAYSSN